MRCWNGGTAVRVLIFVLALVEWGVMDVAIAEPQQNPEKELESWNRAPAMRIVSLAPSATEILYLIGAETQLVGISRQCDYPVAAKLKPRVGDFNRPEPERLDALRPDVVILTEYIRDEDARALEAAGISSLVLPARSVSDVVSGIRLLGRVSGREEAAGQLADRMVAEVEAIRSRVASVPYDRRPTVYVEVDGPSQLYAVGAGSFMHEALLIAGGRNVFENVPDAYRPVSHEEVVVAAPQVIFVDHPFQYKVGVGKRPGWSVIPAVRDGRVYDSTGFDMILLNRPGPRIVRSLEEVSRILHPEVWGER